MHWEENALVDVIEFCKNPTVCNGDNGGN
jgi:hypothetical protein